MSTQGEDRGSQATGGVRANRRAGSEAFGLAQTAATEALAAAAAVDDDKLQIRVRATIGAALVRAGLAAPAVVADQAGEDVPGRAVATLRAARGLLDTGQAHAAQIAAVQALADARATTRMSFRAWAAMEAAQILLETGRPELARNAATEAVEAARESEHRPNELAGLAQRLTVMGLDEPARLAAEGAIKVARAAPDGWARARSLAAVAPALADAGHPEAARAAATEALTAGRDADNFRRRAWAIAEAADALAQTGQTQEARAAAVEALAAAREVSGGYSRVQALVHAGQALDRTGQSELAGQAAELIVEAINSMEPQGRAQSLARAAHVLARTGKGELAVQAVRTVGDGTLRQTVASVAKDLTLSGEARLAMDAARVLDDVQARAEVLGELAGTLTETGQVAAAHAAGTEALDAAREISDVQARAEVLVELAGTLTETGQVAAAHAAGTEALDAARRISDGIERTRALTSMVSALAGIDQIGSAFAASQAIGDMWQRMQVLSKLGQLLAERGQSTAAQTAAEDSLALARALNSIAGFVAVARLLARLGQLAAAQVVAEEALTLARVLASVTGFVAVTRLLADFGQREAAQAVATEALTAARSSQALDAYSAVVDLLTETGQPQAAAAAASEGLVAACETSDLPSRPGRLARFAQILVEAGDIEAARAAASQAVAAARGITDPESRAETLADVAQLLLDLFAPLRSHPPGVAELPPESGAAAGTDEQRRRYLECRAPQSVRRKSEFLIVARITELQATASAMPFTVPALPEQGMLLYFDLDVPAGCEVRGAAVTPIRLPARGDSEEAGFVIRAPKRTGPQTFTITVLWGGQVLARQPITIEISDRPTELMEAVTYSTRQVGSDRTTVALTVSHTVGRKFTYGLYRPGYSPVVDELQLEADPRSRLRLLTRELNRMAKGSEGWRPGGLRDELRARGSDLWRDFLPDKIRETLSSLRVGVDTLSITCGNSTPAVPWEMLHPIDPIAGNSDFLVQLFDVVRSPESTERWCQKFALSPAEIVLPDPDLPGALDEARVIGEIFGQTDHYIREKVKLQQELRDRQFGLLHFVAHDRDGQGTISLAAKQRFAPADLNEFSSHGGKWSSRRPLVFVNACGTATSRQTFTQFTSWAQRFFETGAGGFIGSMWDVRSTTASAFAQKFYEAIYVDGLSFGRALHDAREDARRSADPTWLAYAAHGDHTAIAPRNT
jgi:tetratricopeptide (TPR) repeat protein